MRFLRGHGGRKEVRWLVVDCGHDTPCHVWQLAREKAGYGKERRAGRGTLAHRNAWVAANGPIPEGLLVLHRCDNPPCVNPEHLFLGTHADNAADRDTKGRASDRRGERHPLAKLTPDRVRAILAEPDTSGVTLARRYGVSRSTVSAVRKRKRWPHIVP